MKPLCCKIPAILLLAITLCLQVNGQGFRKTYDFGNYEYGHTVLELQSGGFVLVGTKLLRMDAGGELVWNVDFPTAFGTPVRNIFHNTGKMALETSDGSIVVLANAQGVAGVDNNLYKFDEDGNLIWWKRTLEDEAYDANALVQTQDGGYAFAKNNYLTSVEIVKADDNGDLLWRKHFDFGGVNGVPSLVATSDGGFAVSAVDSTDTDAFRLIVIKTDANGDLQWEKTFATDSYHAGGFMVEGANSTLKIVILKSQVKELRLVSLDFDGNEIWNRKFLDTSIEVEDLTETASGDFVIIGGHYVSSGNQSSFEKDLLLLDAEANVKWHRVFQDGSDFLISARFFSVKGTTDGGFAIGGYAFSTINSNDNMLLIKTNGEGRIYPNQIRGHAYRDVTENCEDDAEQPLSNLIVKADGEQDFYALTNAFGNYALDVLNGEYEISITTPSELWVPCQASIFLEMDSNEATLDFPIQPSIDCALMDVDIVSSLMRPCLDGMYQVSYCNHGTITAVAATVQITLPDHVAYIESSIPLQSSTGQVLIFDVGDVGVEECGIFNIKYSVECDQSILGLSLCAEAHIFPDENCLPQVWSGPNISAASNCEADSVAFTLTNDGGDMPDPFEFIVIEDNVILMTDEFQIGQGQQATVKVPTQNGATYHIVAAQAANFPAILGNPVATTSIEGCVGDVNVGALLQLPADDGEPWLATHCQIVVNSYDPNEKQALPTGWQEQHFIENRTELDYIIRFQNTGTAPAINISVLDTLSPFLDPTTIQPGASSHPYTFNLSKQGIVEFKFEGINLPDSIADETNSHGFVKFRIAQQPDNPIGTVIENTAAIYFDQNDPIITNTTFHTIGEPWVSVVEVELEGLQLFVFPNPVTNTALVRLSEVSLKNERSFCLFDASGREVCRRSFDGEWFLFERKDLTSGIYFFRIESGGKKIGAGKLLVK